MAASAGIILPGQTGAATTTPASGSGTIYIDSVSGQPKYKDSAGVSHGFADKPKDVEATVYVDVANSQGWAGSDAGAWINSAFAYLVANYGSATNGGIIQLAAGSYSFSTPIVCAQLGFSIILRGAGDGNGATILNYTATSGIAVTLSGSSGNDGGVQLENLTITGTAQGNGATAVQWGASAAQATGGTQVFCAGATCKNVSIRRFTTGFAWYTNAGFISYAIEFFNCKVQQCTTAMIPGGEDNIVVGGLIGGCATGIAHTSAAGTETQLFGVAFDDNTTTAISQTSNSCRMSLHACRFENVGGGTSNYITVSAGSISITGGMMQEDLASGGPATGFIQATGGVITVAGLVLYSGGRVVTQAFNVASPTEFSYSNILVHPLTSSPSTTLAVMVPAAYLGTITANTSALTAADTLIKSIPIPANTLLIGETYRIKAFGQYAASVTNAANFRARLGTANSIADALLCTVTTLAGGIATVGFVVEILVTIRSLGATAAVIANGSCLGIPAAGVAVSNQTATVAINSTVTNFLSLTAGVAATTSNLTFTGCVIEPVQLNSAN
jgi:hypothetical protein